MITTKNKTTHNLLIIPLFILVIGFALPVQAEQVCCEVREKSTPPELCNGLVDWKTAENDCSKIKKIGCINSIKSVPLDKCGIKTTTTTDKDKKSEDLNFTPQVSIPGSGFTASAKVPLPENVSIVANYIIAYFKYAIGIIGIIAAVVLMFAGIRWLTAAGNQTIIADSKKYIFSSLSGLILTLGAFLLLSIINTNLINLQSPTVKKIQYYSLEVGCCLKTDKADPSKVTSVSPIGKEECAAITYATTDFKVDQVATTNPNTGKGECVVDTGCCLLDIGIQTGLLEWPWFDDQLCINSMKENACKNEETSRVWSFIPVVNIKKDDVDAVWYHNKKCKDVSDCDQDLICTSAAECREKLRKK